MKDGLRIGSVCTGYGGLDAAVEQVLGGRVVFVADIDKGASKILASRYPDVPNLGDITMVDWSQHEVDVLVGGFPCQDLSYAGRGAGIQEGNRSGLWYAIADAVGILRPRLVIVENVAGIVARRPGMDVVLSSLAALGYDAVWACVRASDVGAPHRRERWFCIAWDAGLDGDAAGKGFQREAGGRVQRQEPGSGRDGLAGRCDAAADPGRWDGEPREELAAQGREPDPGSSSGPGVPVDWRQYEPAIRQWERILGRSAPAPTELGPFGPRLSARFTEWMMGLPDGWVTAVPGLSRPKQLKALGNGVVPQQAVHALRLILSSVGRIT